MKIRDNRWWYLWVLALALVILYDVGAFSSTPAPVATPALHSSGIAPLEVAGKLSDTEKARNKEILKILQKDRLNALTPGLPAWVKNHLITFEDSGEQGVAFSRSVAWGVGWYKGQLFYWFAYSNSDGWVQMDLSIRIDEKDIDAINGIKPDDPGHVPAEDRMVNARIGGDLDTAGTATHVAFNGGGVDWTDWTEEFCLKPSTTLCDTAGALEKYFLPAANSILSTKLMFVRRGRIPY
ncbi:MAG: hypothetical protein A3A26_03380 [Candidatus Zambryskibacteria bacterium RIFCSPLOWO2_01_FULL_47_14]|uniref:Uncharacterized protein n=1 Tax=Candidatus Zambryskibacteria bacterium RIFCSPLOWO2_01_FULL_47_14 TaxID=1802763 RepID=A0A1G2U8K5_9BACT|nr:MAG: hypothetical protein A3A26_03380 [Candidatus Zambryskibacteria bacterium RIFCSPLOWO2_01_FULL_47_14]